MKTKGNFLGSKIVVTFMTILLSGCLPTTDKDNETLKVGAIPDQNPEKLNRLYKDLTDELNDKLKAKVKYVPVTNYSSAVTAFRTGHLDLVWFGGLTGVQARLQTPGSVVLAQRDIDAEFKSVFIANKNSKLPKVKDINGLSVLIGKRFSFGSESSTSGRLMPQYFLEKAGVKITDFKGGFPGFSGSHDATIALVQSGSYEAGALNKQIWRSNIKKNLVDLEKVEVIWVSPSYHDYHWLAQGNLDDRFGKDFTKKLKLVFLELKEDSPRQSRILKMFGTKRFIPADATQYKEIERIGRNLGKIK